MTITFLMKVYFFRHGQKHTEKKPAILNILLSSGLKINLWSYKVILIVISNYFTNYFSKIRTVP